MISLPSGDQDGEDSTPGVCVNRRAPEPSAFTTYSSGLPSRLMVQAI